MNAVKYEHVYNYKVTNFLQNYSRHFSFNSINDEIKNSLNLKEFTSKLKSTFLD